MAKNKKKTNKAKKVLKKKTAVARVVKKKAMPKKAVQKSKPAKKSKASTTKTSKISKPIKVQPKKMTMVEKPLKNNINWSDFVTPLDDRLIVHLEKAEKRTPGGLIIPDSVASTSGHYKGQVVAVGRGHRDSKGKIRPMDVQVGHKVLFSEYSGTKVNWSGQEVIILRENDVLGIVS